MHQIERHELLHLEKYPHANIIDLGIGDTTEPLPTMVTSSMVDVSYKGSFYWIGRDNAYKLVTLRINVHICKMALPVVVGKNQNPKILDQDALIILCVRMCLCFETSYINN